jgi:hypothetical protein
MRSSKIDKCGHGWLLVFVVLGLGVAVGLCYADETGARNSSLGVLKLEGKHVEYLALHRKDGHVEQITRPNETIKLPLGEYRLQEVRLESGYTCRSMGIFRWVTIAVDEPATLKVGSPLVPTIKVQRQGRILRLNYELQGVGGESYIAGARSKPPTFAVYKGQKKIASGHFEYG